MGRRGTKPKPTALKILAGNPGRRTLNTNVEPVGDIKIPAVPDYLDETARAEWDRVAGDLVKLRVLTDADRAVLAAYCRSWSEVVQAAKKIDECGRYHVTTKGFPMTAPWVNDLQRFHKEMVRYAAELGMTPSARTSVKAIPELPDADIKKKFFGKKCG